MSELKELLDDNFKIVADKHDQALLLPVEAWVKFYRQKKFVRRMSSLFAMDCDRLTDAQVDSLFSLLEPTSCIIYPTFSHLSKAKDGLNCYRVLVELTEGYEPWEHIVVWEAMQDRFGCLDPATRNNPALGYFLPSSQSSAPAIVLNDGTPIATTDLLDLGKELGYKAEKPFDATEVGNREHATKVPPAKSAVLNEMRLWARGSGGEVAGTAVAMLEGKGRYESGTRNTSLMRLAGRLGQIWPDVSPLGLANMFAGPQWAMMSPDDDITIDMFVDMIHRCQQGTLQELELQRSATISKATAGGRKEPVTADEREVIKKYFGEYWERHVVAVNNKDCYLLQPNGWYNATPLSKDNLQTASRDRLAIFPEVTWEYTRTIKSPGGEESSKKSIKNLQQYLNQYATVVDHVVFDWTEAPDPWDAATRTVFLKPNYKRLLPVGSEEIQEWLECMDPILCDMLACMPKLDSPLPVLVATGERASGKTLMAHGVAQIYAPAPVDSNAGFGEFSANALKGCPILLADERAPDLYRKQGTTFLRSFLTTPIHKVNEKFQSRIDIRGYLRLIVTGNNKNLLETSEHMDSADRAALAERLVHVDFTPGVKHLNKVGKGRIQKHWLNERALAKHILYLSENWEIRNPGRRLLVEQPIGDFHNSLASQSGPAGDVAAWLLYFLEDPSAVSTLNMPVGVRDGQLLVNNKAVVQGWARYMDGYPKPSPAVAGRALRSLSTGQRKKLNTVKGRHNVYVIDTELLRSPNENLQILEDLDKVLAKSS